MKNLLQDIRLQFGSALALYRLLFLNIVLFLVLMILKTLLFITGYGDGLFANTVDLLSLPANPGKLIFQPWSLISYMFLHVDLLHVLFNMLILYWTGKLFHEYLGGERLWATYVLGGLAGAGMYLLAYNTIPVLKPQLEFSHLIGASAGVIAVMVAIATLLPDYTVHLLLFGAVRLKYIAIASILLYVISIPKGNAGGHIAHLGGALFGFLMVHQLRRGRNLTGWLTNLGRRFSSNPSRRSLRKVETARSRESHREKMVASQETIDRILDKINKSGFDSLTREEKEILYRASGKN